MHCMAFFSVTGGLVLIELITHQKQYKNDIAFQNWESYLQAQ